MSEFKLRNLIVLLGPAPFAVFLFWIGSNPHSVFPWVAAAAFYIGLGVWLVKQFRRAMHPRKE